MSTATNTQIATTVNNDPACIADCTDSLCKSDEVVTAQIVATDPPTFCHDQCNSDCKTDDDLVREATGIANAAFVMTADLSLVEERLRKEATIPAHQITVAIAEYRKFMALIAAGHHGLSMISPLVDEVWHAHILHTQDYADFCRTAVGRFVHHQPNSSRDPIPATEGPRFIEIYHTVYGELPDVWKRNAGEISGRCSVV
jgi:hypothetical protein